MTLGAGPGVMLSERQRYYPEDPGNPPFFKDPHTGKAGPGGWLRDLVRLQKSDVPARNRLEVRLLPHMRIYVCEYMK